MSFNNAPISKGLMIALAATSIGISIFDIKYYLPLQLVPHISRHHQYWRLLTQPLAYASSPELFVAELLLFQVGTQIERFFGSYRFASFILAATIVSSVLSFASLLAFHTIGYYLNRIPAGPTALIFSLVYHYSRIVPTAYTFTIFSVPLSNKSFTYLIAAQLALSQWPSSGVLALIGFFVGQLSRADTGLKTYRISPRLYNLLGSLILPFIGSTRPPRRSVLAMPADSTSAADDADEPERVTTQSATASGAAANAPSVVSQWVNELTATRQQPALRRVSDAEISQVSAMFQDIPRAQIVSALQQSPNIERAVEMLLAR
ncbi:hypothetical protein EXIGLDRAFT_716145 [Exidia glandulosa HHB12029]|uniref:CUE domain-containing protein n=1 Tax=Exidia glandulosa HHB12029 TaxID=1314781 RepID=A0A165QW17_EXIGL|nr:hypothetical protein EXIGLDRAFT_716145 [Exidia glandulosa HHB12029]